MKAFKYKLKVCESGLEYAHGMFQNIDEYYFPAPVNLFVNYKSVFVLSEKDVTGRRVQATDVEEIEIGDAVMEGKLIVLATHVTAMKAGEKEIQEILKLLKSDD